MALATEKPVQVAGTVPGVTDDPSSVAQSVPQSRAGRKARMQMTDSA